MFTGGSDSTYVAYKLLTETSDEVTLMMNVSTSARGESKASNWLIVPDQFERLVALISELRTYRDLKVRWNAAVPSNISSFDVDSWISYGIHTAADDFNSGIYDRLVTGLSWEQNDNALFKHSKVKGLSNLIDGPRVFHSKVRRGSLWNPLVTHDFHENYGRWHVLKYLPENLRRKALVCANASDPCGDCSKCLLDSRVTELMGKGYTSSDVDDWRRERCLEYGGGNGRYLPYTIWIRIDGRDGRHRTKRGVAEDCPMDELPMFASTKEELIRWYDTIEYNPQIDYRIQRWGLTKDAWSPEA